MSQAERRLDTDRLTKFGVVVGLSLFALGAGGELIGHALYETLPAWENTVLFSAEVLGIAVVFLSIFLFAIFIPLVR